MLFRSIHMDHLEAPLYTDAEDFSYRLDKNNVDPEQEYAELASTRIKYNALIDSMTTEFRKIKSVIK